MGGSVALRKVLRDYWVTGWAVGNGAAATSGYEAEMAGLAKVEVAWSPAELAEVQLK